MPKAVALRWFFSSFILAVLFVLPAHAKLKSSDDLIDKSSSKYAALVMDVDTGEVLYARNPDSKRYPASLTKMMTLYMVFEALKNGDMSLTERLTVSKRASEQPQTNISLKEGDTITVHDAIQALVVRSANDVAVVLAESIAKSEWNFAMQMTAKARQLGMRKTVFRNAHGLPDKGQVTTARDMAKLGVALRRDFPQYYDYFKTEKFHWRGTTYTSHNRVMQKYDGVDGIKTGYIRMSGFNLVTSVSRDGYHLIAVVMGGPTSSIRDQHMMSLLDDSFTTLAERGDQPRMFANAPKPKEKPNWSQNNTIEKEAPFKVARYDRSYKSSGSDFDGMNIVPVSKPEPAGEKKRPLFEISFRSGESELPQLEPANLREPPRAKGDWGIQVGAFSDEPSAQAAANKAMRIAYDQLKFSDISVTDAGNKATSIHRARLANLSRYQAKTACEQLRAKNAQCFVFRTSAQQKL